MRTLLLFLALSLGACTSLPSEPWHLMLSHDRDGNVLAGDADNLASAVRQGCQVRIAWGARRKADPSQTVEHVVEATWISVRNGRNVQAQVDGFMANLPVLGNPPEDHPRVARFGGTERAVLWRAALSTDGKFDAIWYGASDGELKVRIPQRHPMRWYADCAVAPAPPLYPPIDSD